MRHLLLSLFALFIAFTLPINDAEAKRMGGGKSSGMQRNTPMQRDAAPQQAQTPPAGAPGAAGAAAGKRSWMGPIAGLAAGLGLAALFSHLGMGEEMANFLMIALLVMVAFMVVRWLMRRSQPQTAQPMAYAGAARPAEPVRFDVAGALPGSPAAEAAASVSALPPGFDAAAFERQAKVNFIRLQAAHDAGNLDDIREFTTPEMYAEIKLDLDERTNQDARTEVVTLNAQVLEAVEENNRQIVSVRFTGLIREDSATAEPLDEVWHLTRPANGKGGWLIAGIQQTA